MTIKDRVKVYCSFKNIAISQFEKRSKLSNGYLNQVQHRPSAEKIEGIATAFPDLNIDWLLTGNGEMLKSDTPTASEPATLVPLLPISAQGGPLNDFVVSVRKQDCERITSPIKGADFAMTVTGDSMAPEYPSGAQILIKRINERAFINWGQVYVLDTCNGSVIKKLMPADDPGKVRCESINPAYPPFEVSLSDVFGIYRVLLCMSVK